VVRSIQTHISWVFIASPFVFKLKKPVNMGFLDFSTLEKRHYFCRRELELNRRLCPEIYLAVMPIYESDAGFSFDDADGEIADYVVKMREVPHGWFLSELLAKGAVGETEINRVISRLHQFYDSEIPTAEIEEWGRPERLKISTDENFEQVLPFLEKTISMRSAISRTNSTPRTRRYSKNVFNSAAFAIAMAICTSITSISRRKRRPSSIASSSTTVSASSTLPTISPFSRWILISRGNTNLETSFYGMRCMNFATQVC
jgi:aminoglycoside phosphotransferase family enzyme